MLDPDLNNSLKENPGEIMNIRQSKSIDAHYKLNPSLFLGVSPGD